MVYVSWTVTAAVLQSIMLLITGILETLLYQTKVYVYLVCWKVFRHSFIHKPCPKFHYILWKTFKVATLNNYCRTFRQISYTNSLPFHCRRGGRGGGHYVAMPFYYSYQVSFGCFFF